MGMCDMLDAERTLLPAVSSEEGATMTIVLTACQTSNTAPDTGPSQGATRHAAMSCVRANWTRVFARVAALDKGRAKIFSPLFPSSISSELAAYVGESAAFLTCVLSMIAEDVKSWLAVDSRCRFLSRP